LFVNHETKDSQHGSAAIVELNTTLLVFSIFRESIPTEIDRIVTEVTNKLSTTTVLHDEKLKDSDEEKNLEKTLSGNCGECSPTVGNGVECGSSGVNISRKMDSSTGNNVTGEGKHTDAAVLDLGVTELIEPFLASIAKEVEGVK